MRRGYHAHPIIDRRCQNSGYVHRHVPVVGKRAGADVHLQVRVRVGAGKQLSPVYHTKIRYGGVVPVHQSGSEQPFGHGR